jgi:hypothetical protein
LSRTKKNQKTKKTGVKPKVNQNKPKCKCKSAVRLFYLSPGGLRAARRTGMRACRQAGRRAGGQARSCQDAATRVCMRALRGGHACSQAGRLACMRQGRRADMRERTQPDRHACMRACRHAGMRACTLAASMHASQPALRDKSCPRNRFEHEPNRDAAQLSVGFAARCPARRKTRSRDRLELGRWAPSCRTRAGNGSSAPSHWKRCLRSCFGVGVKAALQSARSIRWLQ